MSQVDKIRDKLLLQFQRVQRKFKPERSKEITNADLELASLQYFTSEPAHNEYGENNLEWLHNRLVRLTTEQMALYKLRFEDGLTMKQIASNLKLSPSSVHAHLNKMYEVLRAPD